MNAASLPDNLLRRMKPEDRKRMGVQTGEEAMAKFVAKSEGELQDKICQYLDLKGIVYIRPRMDKRPTFRTGWPDITFAVRGQGIALEAKHEKKGLDADQKTVIPMLQRNGWHVYLVRDLQAAIDVVRQHLEYPNPQTCRPSNITAEDLEC